MLLMGLRLTAPPFCEQACILQQIFTVKPQWLVGAIFLRERVIRGIIRLPSFHLDPILFVIKRKQLEFPWYLVVDSCPGILSMCHPSGEKEYVRDISAI